MLNTRTLDAACGPQIRLAGEQRRGARSPLSNSFGFGGNNCVLVFGDGAVGRGLVSAPAGTLFVDGVAFWAPTLPGWARARAVFRGEAEPLAVAAKRPAPELLAAAERRRAPDTVALALEVAAAALRESGCAADALPSVFTSMHGDLGVTDYMCATLATQPTLISPTKFHNSVHNAAAGYWTIATGCREASTALTAFDASFAAGLLEAAAQCRADARAVLLVAFDVEAVGPLRSVTASDGPARLRARARAERERADASPRSTGRWPRVRRRRRPVARRRRARSPAMPWPMPCRCSRRSRSMRPPERTARSPCACRATSRWC